MKLQLLSDLHLERHPDFMPQAVEGADVLVLAGDIGSYQSSSLLRTEDFGLGRFSPRLHPDRWKRVLYVPGNHEFDGLEFAAAYARLRALCDQLGIEWLEREVVVIDQVRFVGTTLWSDFEAFAGAQHDLSQQMKLRDKAFRAANFYLKKNTTLRDGRPLLAQDMRELALECQSWLRGALARPFAGSTVVVTHFAPTLRSADPRYGLTPGTAGFCNALDDWLDQADLWLHGHLHCPHDYRAGRCRVVANPLGYAGKNEQQGFRPGLCIEVPPPLAR